MGVDVILEPLSVDQALEVLSPEEKRIIQDSKDLGYIARIKTMTSEELRRCDRWGPRKGKLKHYLQIESDWLKMEIFFLEKRLGREPTECEVLEDIDKTGIYHRFRAFYLMKYPENVDWPEAA